MDDLVGFGRAAEKFLGLVQASMGTLYRPRAIRKEGEASADAEAYRVIALANAEREASLVRSDTEAELAKRAVARLRYQEMSKQNNIESVVDKTLKYIEDADIDEKTDQDWLNYFFEGCATVSNRDVQELWAKVLARKVTGRGELSRKLVDCLRWLDTSTAEQFLIFAPRLYLFRGFITTTVEFDEQALVKSFCNPVDGAILEEIGLTKENLSKTFRFDFCSLIITCQELSDRSLEFRKFFELTRLHTHKRWSNRLKDDSSFAKELDHGALRSDRF